MRRKVGVSKAADGVEQDPKTHRLTDIEVHEVSVVDRPANRRKFLVVKHDTTGKAERVPAMKIAAKAKADLAQVLKGILDAAATVSKSLEAAEVVEGVDTPTALTEALLAIGKLAGVTWQQEPAKKPEGDVAKAGRKLSQARQEKLRAAYSKLEEVLAEVTDSEEETPAPAAAVPFEAAKSVPATPPATPPAAAPPPPAAPAADPMIANALKEMTTTLATLTKAVTIQKDRIDKMSGQAGASQQQVSTEKAAADASREEEVSWPLDMNRPITKATTPVGKSFFATK